MQLNLEHIHFHGVELPARPRREAAARPSVRSGQSAAAGHRSGEGEEGALAPGVAWVMRQFGLAPEIYRTRALSRRLSACQRRVGVRQPEELRARLEREPALLSPALDTLLIGVTEFFRDSAVFAQLEAEVLPDLLRRRSRVRIYAPGVSSGEELYSVAMLLAEAGELARAELTGVDCRPEAIARAQAGFFGSDELAAVPTELRARYFEPARNPTGRRARTLLRERIRWVTADLFAFTLPGPADLILFRNVAIYFSPAAAERAWAVLLGQLAPGGWLITGRAEKPPAHAPLMRVAPSVYRKFPE